MLEKQAHPLPPPPHKAYHPLTHIFPSIIPPAEVPRNFAPLHTWFDATRLPPFPRILDPHLNAAARSTFYDPSQFPGVMELALLGDTVLKTIIIERLQELARCGRASYVADLSSRLNQNITFCYLCMAYDMIDLRGGMPPQQKSYADVFEAYIGALWRESNDAGKAHVRQVVRDIFSPAVFPIIAQWEDGRREFGRAPGLGQVRKAKLKVKLQDGLRRIGVSKALAEGIRPRYRDRRSRSRGPSVPPKAVTPRVGATAAHPVIDLTLEDEEDDESDSDSVIYLSESEWKQINAEAGPSRRSRARAEPDADSDMDLTDADSDIIPTVFVDTNPEVSSALAPRNLPISPPTLPDALPPSPPASDADDELSPQDNILTTPCPAKTNAPKSKRKHRDPLDTHTASRPEDTYTTAPWGNDPRSVPDWLAAMTPVRPASAVPAKLKQSVEQRSPLRKLGDALGSVRSRVEAAFKRKSVKERVESRREVEVTRREEF